MSRRPSKRQMEKAPEGRGPHPEVLQGSSMIDGAGPAPAESRFHENI